jgi:hypothetical protein
MEVNSYVFEVLVRERSNRVREAMGDAHSLRFALGDALIRMGQRLHGAAPPPMIEPGRSTHEAVRG